MRRGSTFGTLGTRGERPGGSLPRTISAQLVQDGEHYPRVVRDAIGGATVSLWIATANVKEMRVEAPIGSAARARGGSMSILETLDGLAKRGVELRLLHAGVPSRAFRTELLRHRSLGRFKRQCPRVHLKMIAVDGRLLYLGSANFTGAGLGAKGEGRRNFEMGILTDDDGMLDAAQARFEAIWSGKECGTCRVRVTCPAPLDAVGKAAGADSRSAVALRRRDQTCTTPRSSGRRSGS